MNYTIAAHPTRYKNTIFRARLEARWAAFFDLWGDEHITSRDFWQSWQYEPLDLDGWTPDFMFRSGGTRTWVEVKPFDSLAQWDEVTQKIKSALRYDEPDAEAAAALVEAGADWAKRRRIMSEWCHRRGEFFRLGLNPNCAFLDWGGDVFHKEQERALQLWEEAGNLTRYQPKKDWRSRSVRDDLALLRRRA